jgi:endo-1,4-beta-mannosidase
MGGVPQYAAFREKDEGEFWTDPQLIADFEKTVELVVTRTNTLTGVDYRDDKAILCWETGNELQAPYSWTHEIAAYLQELDPNHLVMDGYYAIDPVPVREEAVLDPMIDIVSSHHYVRDPELLRTFIRTNEEVVAGRKPHVVGEFGFVGTQAVARILDELIASDVSGALVWSLRSHRREGGFYWHSEPFGSGLFKAYHWPGFASGDDYDERDLLYAGEGREDDRYLKIVFRDPAQLSRVEIDHSPDSGTP